MYVILIASSFYVTNYRNMDLTAQSPVRLKSTVIFLCCIFSKFLYLTFHSTFRVNVDNNKQLVISTHPVQQIICLFLHSYATLATFLQIFNSLNFKQTIQDNPENIFTIATAIGAAVTFTSSLHFYWFGRQNFVHICQWSIKFSLDCPEKLFNLKEKVGIFIWLLSSLIFVLYIIIKPLLQITFEKGFDNVYMSDDRLWYPFDLHKESNSLTLKYFLSVLAILSHTYLCFIDQVNGIILPAFASAISYNVSRVVLRFLDENKHLCLQQLNDLYKELKEINLLLNETFNKVILGCCICAMAYFTQYFPFLVNPGEFFNQWRVVICYYFFNYVFMWLLAAGSSINMGKLSEYIYNNRHESCYKDNIQTLLLVSELSERPLGLRCLNFLITHGFIVKIFSTLLTYIFVLLQFLSVRNFKTTGEMLKNDSFH